jgi:hypothetical protein
MASITSGPFANPVHDGYLADPFCFRHGDWYYAVGTGRTECYAPSFKGPVVPMVKSRDLRQWVESCGTRNKGSSM